MPEVVWQNAGDCDRRVFRDMLGSFMTGVTIVAARAADGSTRAFTANSFTSVSLDPPLILVCLAKASLSYDVFSTVPEFSVSILGDSQRELSSVFATRGAAKEDALRSLSVNDSPYVNGALAVMLCSRRELIDAGDHMILLGDVTKFTTGAGLPLGFFKGGYVSLGLVERQLERLSSPLVVGGLLDVDGQVLLCRRPGSPHWEIPRRAAAQGEPHSKLLEDLFTRLGAPAQSSFLYSLFQELGDRHMTLIFSMESTRADLRQAPEEGVEIGYFGEADEPWKLVRGAMSEGLLQRFFRERAAGCFGLYYDTSDGGRVSPLGGKGMHWTQWLPESSATPTLSATRQGF